MKRYLWYDWQSMTLSKLVELSRPSLSALSLRVQAISEKKEILAEWSSFGRPLSKTFFLRCCCFGYSEGLTGRSSGDYRIGLNHFCRTVTKGMNRVSSCSVTSFLLLQYRVMLWQNVSRQPSLRIPYNMHFSGLRPL